MKRSKKDRRASANVPWYSIALLAAESQRVIWLRLLRLGAGGPGATREAQRMVSEKLLAASHATAALMTGASPDHIVKAYRRKVRANARRLS
jgi:hypothetical protein